MSRMSIQWQNTLYRTIYGHFVWSGNHKIRGRDQFFMILYQDLYVDSPFFLGIQNNWPNHWNSVRFSFGYQTNKLKPLEHGNTWQFHSMKILTGNLSPKNYLPSPIIIVELQWETGFRDRDCVFHANIIEGLERRRGWKASSIWDQWFHQCLMWLCKIRTNTSICEELEERTRNKSKLHMFPLLQKKCKSFREEHSWLCMMYLSMSHWAWQPSEYFSGIEWSCVNAHGQKERNPLSLVMHSTMLF